MNYSVVVVDDHFLLSQAIGGLVQEFENFDVLYLCKNGQDLLDKFNDPINIPDLVLMDIKMPILNGIETTERLKIKYPNVKVLALSIEEDEYTILKMLRAGAKGYLMKDTKDFDFIGNVEGRDLFNEKADVVVCEGFTGNVVLKNSESFYVMLKKKGKSDEFFDRFNYEIYGGTPILGINSTVIICHGISSPLAIKNSLILAKETSDANLPEKIKQAFI